jgi:hypothetical protein
LVGVFLDLEPARGCGFVCVDAGGGLGEWADWLRMKDSLPAMEGGDLFVAVLR